MAFMSYAPKNCVLCSHFERITGPDGVWCNDKHVRHPVSPARETQCAFWQREPGADDETDLDLWREVMHRAFPPKAEETLVPRARPPQALERFDRSIMADYYPVQEMLSRGR